LFAEGLLAAGMLTTILATLSALSGVVALPARTPTACESTPRNLLRLDDDSSIDSWAPGASVVVEGIVKSWSSPYKLVVEVRRLLTDTAPQKCEGWQ
jgi:hypothetical protein